MKAILKNKIKITVLFIVSILIIFPLYSISQGHKFILDVHFDQPGIKTLFIGEAYYYKLKPYHSAQLEYDSSNVNNNTFRFEGTILYPTAFRLFPIDNSIKFNELIFIDTGYQEITIVKKNNSFIVKGNTKIEKEHRTFLTYMNIQTIDDKMNQENLLSYVEDNPNSFVALFAMINQAFMYPHIPVLTSIKNAFGTRIKQTEAYKYYATLYAENRKISGYIVNTGKKQPLQLNFVNTAGKYTLLIFWVNGCAPCLKEMGQIKVEYSEDLKSRLNIISINTDERKYFPESFAYVKKQNFPWRNYWDWDEENILKYIFIPQYPSNVLLDRTSKIIAKDVDFDEINQFLIHP